MRILLLYPCFRKEYTQDSDYPIALGYLAAVLRSGSLDVQIQHHIFDEDALNYDKSKYERFDFILIHPMFVTIKNILKLTKKIKDDFPSVKIALADSEQHQHEMLIGGPQAEDIAIYILDKYPWLNFILVGEAEHSLLELCLALKDNGRLEDVPGLFYREDNRILKSKLPNRLLEMDSILFPARDYLDKSILPDGGNSQSVRVQSSRGCLSPCSYCIEGTSNRYRGGGYKAWRGRDILKFLDEIENLYHKYQVRFINVIDSSFEDPGRAGIKRIEQFCQETIRRKIKVSFKLHFRAETFKDVKDSFFNLLKNAGVDILIVGIESGIEEELKSYEKIATVKQIRDAIRRIDLQDKFFTLCGHMMFSPYITLEDIYRKLEFLISINRAWDYRDVSHNMLVFWGSLMHHKLKADNLVEDDSEPISLVRYRFKDNRILKVAEAMGDLKVVYSQVPRIQNAVYDGWNLLSRYKNPMNKHLWIMDKDYRVYKDGFFTFLKNLQEFYVDYFKRTLELANDTWEGEQHKTMEKQAASFLSGKDLEIEKLNSNFLTALEKKGLNTNSLYLRTWFSYLDTSRNTSTSEVLKI